MFRPLPLHPEGAFGQVEIAEPQRDDLGYAHAGGVEQFEERPVAARQVILEVGRGQYPFDLVGGEDGGQLATGLRAFEQLAGIGPQQRLCLQEAEVAA